MNVSSSNYHPVFFRSCFRLMIGCVCELIGVCAATLRIATVILLEILSGILICIPFLWTSRSFGVRNKLVILSQRDLRIRMLFSARRSGVWLIDSSKKFRPLWLLSWLVVCVPLIVLDGKNVEFSSIATTTSIFV